VSVPPPTAADGPTVHPAVAALGFLLGTWAGRGTGGYATIAPFAYEEEVRVSHVGRPYLSYAQRTWHPDDGRAMHAETGYLRLGEGGHVEMVIAHPTGVVEVEEGTLSGRTLELRSRVVASTSTAKEVTALTRRISVEGDVLDYVVGMGAVGQELQEHLTGTLRRVAP